MNAERLLKMAEFLEVLPPHKFDFGQYVWVGDKSPAEALASPDEHCGTTACAVGWMPAVFPGDFKWSDSRFGFTVMPLSGFEPGSEMEDSAAQFLDITNRQYMFLFIPGESRLDSDASAIQVAAQIRAFVSSDGITDWKPEHEDVTEDNAQ